jgi:hypothetical protein
MDVTGSAREDFNGHHVMDIKATWLSACPNGMNGGDIQLADGTIINPRLGGGGGWRGGGGDGGGPGGGGGGQPQE